MKLEAGRLKEAVLEAIASEDRVERDIKKKNVGNIINRTQ